MGRQLLSLLTVVLVVNTAPSNSWASDIQSYFNYSDKNQFADPYRNIRRNGDNFEEIILDELSKAKNTVDVAVQEIRVPSIAKKLVELKKAGVKVRFVMEDTYNYAISDIDGKNSNEHQASRESEYFKFCDKNSDGKLSQEEIADRDAIWILRQAKIPLIDDTENGTQANGLMHHKFIVIDGKRLVVTSANFTLSDFVGDYTNRQTRGNANGMLVIEDARVADIFSQEFSYLWGDGPGGKKNSAFGPDKPYRAPQTVKFSDGTEITVQFAGTSPKRPWAETTAGLIGRTVSKARSSIHGALFVFSEQQISDAMENVHKRYDVDVELMVEPSFAFRPYSKLLDMWGVTLKDEHCGVSEDKREWSPAIDSVGIPGLVKGDYLHHKFAVVDEKVVIFGSHNWSDSANYSNDETLVVVKNPDVAEGFEEEFERQYAKASLGLPSWLEEKISQRNRECRSQKK